VCSVLAGSVFDINFKRENSVLQFECICQGSESVYFASVLVPGHCSCNNVHVVESGCQLGLARLY